MSSEQELTRLQDLRTELLSAKKKVFLLQEQIKQIEESIYSKCQHDWKIDYTNIGEHTEYICTKCGGRDAPSEGCCLAKSERYKHNKG